jgi:hypothetical protein
MSVVSTHTSRFAASAASNAAARELTTSGSLNFLPFSLLFEASLFASFPSFESLSALSLVTFSASVTFSFSISVSAGAASLISFSFSSVRGGAESLFKGVPFCSSGTGAVLAFSCSRGRSPPAVPAAPVPPPVPPRLYPLRSSWSPRLGGAAPLRLQLPPASASPPLLPMGRRS